LIDDELKKAQDKQDPLKIAKWQAELDKALADQLIEKSNLANQIVVANAKGDELDPGILRPKRTRLEFLAIDRMRIEKEGTESVDRMISIVDWYKAQPASISMRMTGTFPIVEINDWDLSDEAGARSFSSEVASDTGEDPRLGTITAITYQEMGGVIRFNLGVFEKESSLTGNERAVATEQGYAMFERFYELEKIELQLTSELNSLLLRQENKNANAVRVKIGEVQQQLKDLSWNENLREVYSFRIARHAYEKTLVDGRLFFAGDLARRRNPKGLLCEGLEKTANKCLRKGSIKLVDRNN